ncbi:NUDIX hydrolase [Salipaludibacillus sp. HK11]|uniref:NUDIX hydrolase n=1 Tax=Salipaludibacillus sp. HK11 TaxID=3394320 RepID=UPI0039FC11BE
MDYYQKLRKHVGNETLILPGSAVIILEGNLVLLQKRNDGDWGLPGGLMEVGESFVETAVREVKEETGLILKEKNLHQFDIFSGKNYYVVAPNGDPYYAVTVLFYTDQFEGELSIDQDETLDLKYFDMNRLPQQIRPSHAYFIQLFSSSKK